MTEDVVARAKRLLDASFTPGPWRVDNDQPDAFDGFRIWHDDGQPGTMYVCSGFHQGHDEGWGDAEFVAAAPVLVRGLIAEVEKLRGVLIDVVYEESGL
jgi:hypothetical protein